MATETITIQLTIPEDLYHRIEAESGRAIDAAILDLIEDRYGSGTGRQWDTGRDSLGDRRVTFDPDAFMRGTGLEPMSDDELDDARQHMPELSPSFTERLIQLRDEERS